MKARVTADEAQVITLFIFDSKGFQMIDTVHTSVELETKARRFFDRARGRPGYKDVPILNSQNLYNHIMGNVDLDDLLAWFYKCGHPRRHVHAHAHMHAYMLHVVYMDMYTSRAHRSNLYRESKYWWPVYIWSRRKRVGMAFQARIILHAAKLR